MYLVSNEKSLPCKQVSPISIKALTSPLAQKVVKLLADKESYPRAIASALSVHEQKIYYHIRKLEKAGIIQKTRTDTQGGATAHFYSLAQPSFAVTFKNFQDTPKLVPAIKEHEFLSPFIKNGTLNALIIVGSPDPHGPEGARSRDGYYGIDLALFLGTYLTYAPHLNVHLDTEIRDNDLKNNLIIIGGPIVNSAAQKINKSLPIHFVNNLIVSSLSGKKYDNDETGIIVKADNPFDKSKKILLIAGSRYSGTRACIIAFLKHFDQITAGNKNKDTIHAKVIEGIDNDSDGIVDDVEIRE
jgi:DNA-binding transcriptional ArsR family regulator